MPPMNIEQMIKARANGQCELCGAQDGLSVYEVQPVKHLDIESCALLCATCMVQIKDKTQTEVHHWHCLNDSMWSEVPAVQVLAWRMLDRLKSEGWPQDLLDMMYLDGERLAWAKAGADIDESHAHKDCYGTLLAVGDTVTLVKDLKVKGAGFTAKQGTAVRNINLPSDDYTHIEGKVEGQRIMILTQYVKRSS